MNEAKIRYAVALFNKDNERILGVFNTKAEADAYGNSNRLPSDYGIQLCFSSLFIGDTPYGNSMNIYNYYNR